MDPGFLYLPVNEVPKISQSEVSDIINHPEKKNPCRAKVKNYTALHPSLTALSISQTVEFEVAGIPTKNAFSTYIIPCVNWKSH